jgi:glycosyltransferase involved in cell wall biosynthesis
MPDTIRLHCVRFLGNIPNVNEWYQAFDVFVLPSIWEGLPVVGVEAQTADLPCIFSSSVTREIHILEKTRFVELKAGPQKWAEAILQALKDTHRTNVGKIIADHGYDISAEAVKLQERYLKLAGEAYENRNTDPSICQ